MKAQGENGPTVMSAGEWFAAVANQPTPHGTGADIADLVKADIEARAELGRQRYGERLRAHNGRRSLVDAYQEVLDLAMYLRQCIEEQGA